MANFAGNLTGFNAEDVPPQDNFDPIPAGWYPVVITDSEMKPTKAGTGEYLQLELTVLEGDHSGRKLWDRLNLDNPNQTAVDIAQRTLSAICHAVGNLTPNDSAELHDIPLMAKVSVKPAADGFDPRNEVKGYKAYGEEAARPTAPPSTQARANRAPTPAAGRGTPPWKKAS